MSHEPKQEASERIKRFVDGMADSGVACEECGSENCATEEYKGIDEIAVYATCADCGHEFEV